MQLPPQRPNEPEWLVTRRAIKAAERQFGLAFAPAQAALGATVLPFFFVDPRSIPTSLLLLGVAAYGAAILAFGFRILRPRTTARTVGRYIVNYVTIAWGVFAVVALFGMTISLLV